ncbi:MAG: hypothetical protein GAK28_00551 [Luteibacter sp.]|uniref:MASE1 domain-containing protein n=1 Tax=Luteibacter sp. TaxID=1886636 RepID=UPI00137C695B|nr:MASE1 domain-containing protein [Luteibacter sp.]KAF1008919.1 MAG: hypothetical protein GAK28_00551 [Luteibacter sp.]
MKGRTGDQERIAMTAMHWQAWGQHVAIAAAYAACYEVTRHVTFSHWILTAGLRLACLLLLPMRYWPALAVGEGLPMVENAIVCLDKFGAAWAVSASVPMIVLCMGWVKPMLARWSLFTPDGRVRMGVLLSATLGCAVLTALKTVLTLVTALLSSPDAWPDLSVPLYFWAYVLGAYLGALTLTPVVLALRERMQVSGRVSLASLWRSPLLRDTMGWALPALAALAWMALATQVDAIRQVARLLMLLPVLMLAWRHGWHGTAVGGMGASIAMAATSQVLLDPDMIHCQVILSLVVSGALMVGARAAQRLPYPTAPATPER